MKQKLFDLKSLEANRTVSNRVNALEYGSKNEIAVIGLSGKFGKADDLEQFWEAIRDGESGIGPLPESRKRLIRQLVSIDEELTDLRFGVGAFMDDIDKFDYPFFSISAKEAGLMDPNQRLFLETAWSAIEAAGYGGKKLAGSKTGVFVGFSSDFGTEYKLAVQQIAPELAGLATPGNIKSIIAGRLAYLLDLKGPSMLVDTACSSSLAAVHLACRSIRNGECEMALAGSVKLNLLPLQAGGDADGIGIEASDGITRAFDDGSDGTGFGEGVAVIVLKPLHKALRDRDCIHAIIKGSALNQDGTSVGVTAPNAVAQEEVLVESWKDAGVDPETITYIEAHGTGTKLGDPIEVTGIERAFRRYTEKRQFCAIGSVKSNIGHLDHAAGIAGLVKAIMALKHKTIPPTIHFRRPNRKIDFIDSPVYVNSRSAYWHAEQTPRRCGVSSFGLSGTNCHVVLEEAPEAPRISVPPSEPEQMLCLSAHNRDVLRVLIDRYRDYVSKHRDADGAALCHTANTGRGHYACRVAVTFKGMDDLREKLDWLAGTDCDKWTRSGIVYGEHRVIGENQPLREPAERKQSELNALSAKATQLIRTWLKDDKIPPSGWSELGRLYVQGADIDWDQLYAGQRAAKADIPAYPFARLSCWLRSQEKPDLRPNRARESEVLHPLVHRHSAQTPDSDIFSTDFHAESHWVLNEHKVLGRCVAPGTTFLEMVRAVCGGDLKERDGLMFQNVVFLTPLQLEGLEWRTVQTILRDEGDDRTFQICSKAASGGEWMTHAQGKVRVVTSPERPAAVDVDRLLQRLPNVVHIHYDDMLPGPIELGPHWHCFRHVHYGEREAVAYLELPSAYRKEAERYWAHPALLDCAANVYLTLLNRDAVFLPFSYKNIQWYGRMPDSLYSYVRIQDSLDGRKETAAFDITLFDRQGNVIAEIEHYMLKRVHGPEQSNIPAQPDESKEYYRFRWVRQPACRPSSEMSADTALFLGNPNGRAGEWAKRWEQAGKPIVFAELGDEYRKTSDCRFTVNGTEQDYRKLFADLKHKKVSQIVHALDLDEEGPVELPGLEKRLNRGVLGLMRLVKAIAASRIKHRIDIALVAEHVYEVTGTEPELRPLAATLFGFGKVVSQEHPHLRCKGIDIDPQTAWVDVIAEMESDSPIYQTAFRDGKRYVEMLERADPVSYPAGTDFTVREDGVYVITGGLGGIGLEVAKHLASKGKANIAVIGRTPLPERHAWDELVGANGDAKLRRKIETVRQLERQGCVVDCIACDVNDLEAMRNVFDRLRSVYGKINGVVHSAGNAGDGMIFTRSEEKFLNVLLPKVKGTLVLDALTEKEELDYFVSFSSMTSFLGGIGQGDYTAANSFLDAFACYRNRRGGRTVTINWPAWKETGMAVDYGVNEAVGVFKPISTRTALAGLEAAVRGPYPRIIPGELNRELLRQIGSDQLFISVSDELLKTENGGSNRGGDRPGPSSRPAGSLEQRLAQIWADVFGIGSVQANDNFFALGGHSILAMHLLRELDREFPGMFDISDIFTYVTVEEMAHYLHGKMNAEPGSGRGESGSAADIRAVQNVPDGTIDRILEQLAGGTLTAEEADQLLQEVDATWNGSKNTSTNK